MSSIYGSTKSTKGLVFYNKKIYSRSKIESKVIGRLNGYSVVEVSDSIILELDSGEIQYWYKVSVDNISGWINDYSLLELPRNGQTAMIMNPNEWVVYKDKKLSEFSHRFKPNENVVITGVSSSDDGFIYRVQHGDREGWLHQSKVNIVDNYTTRLESLYKFKSFNEPFNSIEEIIETIGEDHSSVIANNNSFTIKFNYNSVSVVKHNDKYLIQEFTIIDNYVLRNNIGTGKNINYIKDLLGEKYKTVGCEVKYEYAMSVVANPIYAISFKTHVDNIIQIKLQYYRFD